MLTHLTLENFKAFQKLDNLPIKPITILCGTNSCGKSSILQSILLLKQTIENKNPKQNLLLNGRFVNLGYFRDIIYQKKENDIITFSWAFEDENLAENMEKIIDSLSFFLALNLVGSKFPELWKKTSNEKTKKTTCISLQISLGFIHTKHYGSVGIKEFSIDIEGNNFVKFIHIKDNNYLLIEEGKEAGEIELMFSNLFPLFDAKDTDNVSLTFGALISKLLDTYLQVFTYIGPLRGEPEREYIYRDEVLEIGNKGENAAFLYLAEKEKTIENHFFYNAIQEIFEKKESISLKDAVNEWLTLMKIDHFEAEIINRIIYLSQNASKYDEATRVGIADVGFGVSQIFPIVLEGLRMPKGGTLMLEQPEIHLHPNLQMQMADYFIALALSGKNVMAETHSDHIINRLVRRIVEDDTHKLKDLIGIYFIKPSENGAVYEEIIVDESKGVTNWPADFFDQTATEQMKIMQAGLKKRKNQRVNGKIS